MIAKRRALSGMMSLTVKNVSGILIGCNDASFPDPKSPSVSSFMFNYMQETL